MKDFLFFKVEMMNVTRNNLRSPGTAGRSRRHGCTKRHIQLPSLRVHLK